MKYRAEVDGLRAIAVLSVLIFHAFPEFCPGGFLGVDIFFVISGFLISTIVMTALEKNQFSLRDFYVRRVKRIFPALSCMLIGVYTFGWFTMLSEEFKMLGKHLAGGAFFVSNLLFWNEVGYFDVQAETKPTLHLWSLGIEEQFYIIFPIAAILMWRLKKPLIQLQIIGALLSFIACSYFIGKDSAQAFYSPLTRFWEILAGGILASWHLRIEKSTLPKQGLSDGLTFLGLLLIAASFAFFDKAQAFPSYLSLIPILGASLVIHAGSHSGLARRVLANRVMVWIGHISYPLYLWHWPLLSFPRILNGGEPTVEMRVRSIAFSFALAAMTYHLVEKPLRDSKKIPAKTLIFSLAVAAMGLLGIFTFAGDGIPKRELFTLNPGHYKRVARDIDHFVEPGCGLSPDSAKSFRLCIHDKRQKPVLALLGDSKAEAIYPGLFRESDPDSRFLFIGGSGKEGAPVPVLGDDELFKKYYPLSIKASDAIIQNPDIKLVVVTTAVRALFQLNNIWSIDDLPQSPHYATAYTGFNRMIQKLRGGGKKVLITLDNPTLLDPKDCLARRTAIPFLDQSLGLNQKKDCSIGLDRHLELSKQYRDLIENIRRENEDIVSVYDPTPLLCDQERRVCLPHKEGRLLYSYSDHISDYASSLLAKEIIPQIKEILKR